MAEPIGEVDETVLQARLAAMSRRKARAPWVFLLQAVLAAVLYAVVLGYLRRTQRDIADEKRRAAPPVIEFSN